ncbi:AAA family ATPase [Roseomonas sp. CCTCC AB2023176]|uniref:AAA family ATPase n=1 Tax=Roseomonas sp. CCTCC AB2023176 TaxID=3342640 RepID=UPI0035D7BF08
MLARSVARTGDAGQVAALPLWLSTRAMVRAHCHARMAGGRDLAEAFLSDAEARLQPPAPMLVAIGGLQGTGKTWLARRLAPRIGAAPGALHLRTDEVRKRLAGVGPEDRLPPEAYAPERSAAVHAELFALAEAALRGGHAVVTDAVFLDPAVRAGVEAVAAGAGVPFRGLWLEARMDVLETRISGRRGDASDATVEVMRRAAAVDPGPMNWHRLDASGDALAAALDSLPLKCDAAAPESW